LNLKLPNFCWHWLSEQRLLILTLRQTCRSTAIRLSIALVQPTERRSWAGRPRRITVRGRDAVGIVIEPTRQVPENALGLLRDGLSQA
jgi:hypothetical protein